MTHDTLTHGGPDDASSGAPGVQVADAPRRVWSYPPARILAPIDFGDASNRALGVASALADRYSSALTVLHASIVEAPVYFTHEQASAIERGRTAAAAAAAREMNALVRKVTLAPVRISFVEEAASTAIAEAAARADLIVMGTHGRRGPSRWWLGSVAERTVRESPVPVLVVRAAEGRADDVFKRPLVVASPWASDAEAARYAAGLAEAFGGSLADGAITCEEDLVRERNATILVVPRPSAAMSGFGGSAERLVRSCALPMLFVPTAS